MLILLFTSGQLPQPGIPQGIGQAGGNMIQQGGGMGMNPQGPNYNQSQYSQYSGGGMRPASMQGECGIAPFKHFLCNPEHIIT